LVNPTQVVATISPKRYRIPKDLELVHAYHPRFKELVEFNTKMSIDNLKGNTTTKIKLLIKQKGKCGMCGETLLNEESEFEYDGSTNIHHIQERSKGGRKSSISNLMLTHTTCHELHHKQK
jgi:5-methylcytosine-specific restriction endonuclease McrA